MATARVATTIHENVQQAWYSSGDPCGCHVALRSVDIALRFHPIDTNLLPVLQNVCANQYDPVACRNTGIDIDRINRARHNRDLLDVCSLIAHHKDDAL